MYEGAELRRLFAPRSIAIVGVSPREGSFGARTLENLAHFQGEVFLVNPKYEELFGRRCWPSVSALPEAPDCVVLVTARETVRTLIEECVARGAGGMVVFASGFGEMGEAGMALQRENARLAHDAGMPLIGPNAIGCVNFGNGAAATFMTGLDLHEGYERPAAERKIGVVSQSGAMGFSLTQAMKRGMFFSHMLARGNSSDVDVGDCISFLADEEGCEAIAVLLEGVPEPARLEAAIKKASRLGKPVLLTKMGRGEAGAAASASHTGSLAGSHDAYRTMVERAGGVFVEEVEALMETAQFFAKAPAPKAEGVAIIATSGGAAVVCADAAETAGVPLPQPTPEVSAILKTRIPEYGSAANPVDVTAQVMNDRQSLIDCVEAMLDQEDYGLLATPQPLAAELSIPRFRLLDEVARAKGKMIVIPWMAGWLEGPGAWEIETAQGLGLFRSTRYCFEAIRAWGRWHARRVEDVEKPRLTEPASGLAQRLAAAGGPVTEREAKAILAAYGVPVVEERTAATAAETADAAAALGFPLAMKVDSPDLPHKTEVGGIALGLRSAEQASAEFDAMMERVRRCKPDARVDGVLLQRMVPQGVEIVVGARRDPAFGAVVVVGLGGVFVELMRDSVAAPAPVTPAEAEAMLRRLRGAAVLDGFRDLPAVDVPRLAEVVARVSEFAADAGKGLAELDVNPLICRGSDIVAVDALIIPPEGEDARLAG